MRTRSWMVLALVSGLGGCHKHADQGGGATGGASVGPSAPTSTTDQDALWALAPDGLQVGIVASPRGLAELEGGAVAIKALLATAPELAAPNQQVEAAIKQLTGATTVALADLGLSHDKGGALFVVEHDGEVVIVPVGDRTKFLALTKGHAGATATDADTIGDHTCKTIGAMYACAKPATVLDRLGKGNAATVKEQLAIAGARGDVEVIATIPVLPGVTLGLGLVAQLDRGAFVVRGGLTGAPPIVASRLGVGHRPRVDPETSSGFAIANVVSLFSDVPPIPIASGVTLADVAAAINGPVNALMPAGAVTIDVRVRFKDPAPARALLSQCTTLLAALHATYANEVCHIPVPQYGMDLDAWLDGNELRVGKKGEASDGKPVPLSGVGRELATQDWSLALFGRGTLFGMTNVPGIPAGALPDMLAMTFRGMTLLDELGVGIRQDGATWRFVFTIRTLWANPDDVVAKLMAVPPIDVLTGKSADAANAVAHGAPDSPFALDHRAGFGGLLMPTAVVGMMAAVAVPAFIDYMKKSKKTEAALQLDKIGKNLKVYYIANASFPAGDAPLTPPTSCCTGPNHKCAEEPAVWQQGLWPMIDFEIDEPNLFQYSYHSDGKTFEAHAVGDLDCDGTMITYVLSGAADADGNPHTTLLEPPPNSD